MGPKAKKGGGKGKTKAETGNENGEPLSDADKAKMYESALTSLQLQLAERADKTSRALEERNEMVERVKECQNELTNMGLATGDIKRDMTRQYKSMQEELLSRINALERTIQTLQEELDTSRESLANLEREKDATIAAKDEEIRLMRSKMDDMAEEFGDMLKETLDKMRERIEVSSAGFDFEDPVLQQSRLAA